MKEIKTKTFKDKKADLVTYPPVPGEEESSIPKKKKKKIIYQLNKVVDDVEIDE